MADFTLRFINSAGLVSIMIDWATNSLWDHVEIGTPQDTWIGAHDDGGVQERAGDYCTPTRERCYSLPVADVTAAKVLSFARSKIGTPYDFADIAGLFFHDRRLNTPGRVICSMFVTEVALAAGIQMLNVLPGFTELITPEMLHLSPLLIGRSTYSFGC